MNANYNMCYTIIVIGWFMGGSYGSNTNLTGDTSTVNRPPYGKYNLLHEEEAHVDALVSVTVPFLVGRLY